MDALALLRESINFPVRENNAVLICRTKEIMSVTMSQFLAKVFHWFEVYMQVYMTHEELHNDELLQFGGLEFPQINYHQFNGRPYRYFYSCGFGHVFSDSLLKMDVHTKELKVFYQSKGTLRETSLLTEPGITTSKLFLLLFLYHSEGSSRLCELVF